MFDKSDPRIQLKDKAPITKAKIPTFTGSEYGHFDKFPPVEADETTRTWWLRGQNFYLAYSKVSENGRLIRQEQQDEYVVLLPDKNSQAVVTHDGEKTTVEGYSIVIIPAGESEVQMTIGGEVIRLISTVNEDLKDLPINKKSYEQPDSNVALFEPWPDPVDGPKVRVYSLDVPGKEGRFGRIWRCSTFMINFFEPGVGPRDPSKLSPHSHDDFEQCSLTLEGEFVHHLRWPWTPDKTQWREDEHELVGSPSAAVIPPGVIHTTEAIGAGINLLVDIFSPPRLDFSKQDGWVLNADEYPLPIWAKDSK